MNFRSLSVTALFVEIGRLVSFMRSHKTLFSVGGVFVILSIGMTVLFPQAIRLLVDEGVQGGQLDTVNFLVLLMAGMVVVEAGSTFFHHYCFQLAARKTTADLQRRLLSSLLVQEVGFFDGQTTGELSARLSADTNRLEEMIGKQLPEAIVMSLYGLFGVGLAIYTSPTLTLLVVVLMPVVTVGTLTLGNRLRRLSGPVQEASSDAAQSAYESIAGVRTVRAYHQEAAEVTRYEKKLDHFLARVRRTIATSSALQGVTTFASQGALVAGFWAGSALVLGGSLSPGSVVAFMFYFGLIVRSFRNLSRFSAEVMAIHGATERIHYLMSRETEMPIQGGLRPDAIEGVIELQGVEFRYPTRAELPALRGVDLRIEAGEMIAIVGASGGGKSTIVSLIARMYDPGAGSVRLDGHDLRELDPAWLREHVTIVPQDPTLFSRTIEENLIFGNQQATDAEVSFAVNIAQAEDFIGRLPEGMQTNVGDLGTLFSGGQRQRVAIARAVLRKPKILILDEATSGIDSEGEAFIKKGLRTLPQRPSILIVAHRLSTVVDVDRVIVVDDGKVVATGSHEELLESSQAYRDLVETQLVVE